MGYHKDDNRKAMQREIAGLLGVKPNSDMFAKRGDVWTMIERQRRILNNQRQPSEPITKAKVNSTTLAKQAKALSNAPQVSGTSREHHKTSAAAMLKRINRIANLEKEIRNKTASHAKTSNVYRNYGHFVLDMTPTNK
jgi:hypothetical protein